MKISLNFVQVIAIALCVLFFIGAVLTYNPNDSAMAAVLGMWGVLSGLVVFWEKGMKKADSSPDFDVTGPGDDFH
jgi:hypothetical protein